jgi:ATP-dependent RNA helicase RhlE
MNTFSELTVSPVLKANLGRHGFVEPTPVQAESLPSALAGRDVVATAQTGTGKTLAFVLPILDFLIKKQPAAGIGAVVLSPTRELAMQIDEAFSNLAAGTGIRAAVVVGGVSESSQLNAIRSGAQVLIATPGRLCDYLKRRLVKLGGISLLVLDEADRMLDMGFLPAIESITAAMPKQRQNLLFSATLPASVKHLVERYCNDPVRVTVGSPTKPAEYVDLHVYEVEQDRKLGLLQHMLNESQGSYLVFARTKRGVDRLAKRLSAHGVSVGNIHGDRTQSQRNHALLSFQRGHHRVLVATDVAARGIHVEGIAHVVNYDLPNAPEDFIHRVGRTGRAGARGTASTFATRSERGEINKIEHALRIQLTKCEVSAGVARDEKPVATVHAFDAPRRQETAQSPWHPKRGQTRSYEPSKRRGRRAW